MNISKTLTIVLAALLSTLSARATEIISPNGKIKATIETTTDGGYGEILLSVNHNGKPVMTRTELGIQTTAQTFDGNMRLVYVGKPRHVKDNYKMITGKRSHCVNEATECKFTFVNDKAQRLGVTLRAYNDGLTFRYDIVPLKADERITAEHTTYIIPEGTKRWMQEFELGYERFFPLTQSGVDTNRPGVTHWGYPALLETSPGVFTLITEANISRGNSATSLYNNKASHRYEVSLTGDCRTSGKRWFSPWRVLIIGQLADVVESTLVTDVSAPSKVKNTRWIQPGTAAWIYWAHNHGSRDYSILASYVDLAHEMQWPYHLIDAEWDAMGNGGKIEDIVNYATSRGVKSLLWYNSSTAWMGPGPLYRLNTKENRRKEFAWLNQIGVSGIKVDFFSGDSTSTMDYCIDILEDAAAHRLMVNFHGATVPRGWQRTYPHLVTVEGVYGAEWYNNNGRLTNRAASHNATLPFTRNVIGPMDYTPGTFTDSQHPHITTHGHELALPFLFESAIQHMPDRPSTYRALPHEVRTLLAQMPTTWDDTRLLAGYPGVDVVLARRKGDTWYIVGINGTDTSRTLRFPLTSILAHSKKAVHQSTLTLYQDNAEGDGFVIEDKGLLSSYVDGFAVECLPRGGFVITVD